MHLRRPFSSRRRRTKRELLPTKKQTQHTGAGPTEAEGVQEEGQATNLLEMESRSRKETGEVGPTGLEVAMSGGVAKTSMMKDNISNLEAVVEAEVTTAEDHSTQREAPREVVDVETSTPETRTTGPPPKPRTPFLIKSLISWRGWCRPTTRR